MAFISKDGDYTLLVLPDKNIVYPRKDNGNFSTLYQWECGFAVGDPTSFDNPDLFLMSLVWDQNRPEYIIEQAVNGKFKDFDLINNEDNGSWTLNYYCHYQKQHCKDRYNHNISAIDLEQRILENIPPEEVLKIACEKAIILPVLYENGEIVTKDTNEVWNVNQIGYIFATHDDVKDLFGELNEETLTNARGLIGEELAIHSQFDKGNLFGYRLFRENHQMAENWGYLGESDLAIWKIAQDLPKELKFLIDSLQYVEQDDVKVLMNTAETVESEEER